MWKELSLSFQVDYNKRPRESEERRRMSVWDLPAEEIPHWFSCLTSTWFSAVLSRNWPSECCADNQQCRWSTKNSHKHAPTAFGYTGFVWSACTLLESESSPSVFLMLPHTPMWIGNKLSSINCSTTVCGTCRPQNSAPITMFSTQEESARHSSQSENQPELERIVHTRWCCLGVFNTMTTVDRQLTGNNAGGWARVSETCSS